MAITPFLIAVAISRLYIIGEANFFSPALLFGWLGTVVAVWVSWLLVPDGKTQGEPGPPNAAHLFAMFSAQSTILFLGSGLLSPLVVRGVTFESEELRRLVYLVLPWFLLAWPITSMLVLVWRIDAANTGIRSTASIFIIALFTANTFLDSPPYRSAVSAREEQQAAPEPFRLTQNLIER